MRKFEARADEGSNTKTWDKVILGLYFFTTVVLIAGVSALDLRYGWSTLSKFYIIVGIFLYIISFYISTWAMVTNKHFEGTVRIQEDRNHNIIYVLN